MNTQRTTPARGLALDVDTSRAIVGAHRAVVAADGEVSRSGAKVLEVLATTLGVEAHAREWGAPSSRPLAAALHDPSLRRALVDSLLIGACIDGAVTEAREAVIVRAANALGVRSPWVALLPALRQRRAFTIKRALATRSPDARRLFERTWKEEGVLGIARALLFVAGAHRDRSLATRFRQLAGSPEGTFGRAFHDHIVSRGMAFPGEAGGVPERMVHHDLMHVLNGYGTDPAGECELAGFYAGCTGGEPFTFVVTALVTFHLGIAGVSPSVVVPATGAFDPARVMAAFLRGRQVAIDVMGPWNYWELMGLPLARARERLGILE